MEELEHTSEESTEQTGAEQSRKVDANKIPKPGPAGGSVEASEQGSPLTDDTIAIKKNKLAGDKKPPINFDENGASNTENVNEEAPKPAERRLKIFCHNCAQKLDLTDMEPFSSVDCPSCNREIIVPKWWDNYLLEESCGVGGMAKVFRGLDLALDREVAIKILNNDIANDDNRRKLFLHEARTAATLNHYAILPIYTCGEFEGQAYFVMQYMGGGSLDQEFEHYHDHPLSISEATRWLKDICEALDNARRHGIIHHDIKPGNFMLDDDRNVKIGDFGISQALFDSRSEEMSKLTAQWGSPDYVSPEKIQTGKESYLGDIYSLGATFYHLLANETPFDNHDVELMLKTKTIKDPIDIRKLRDDIPEYLATLIMSMMDRTPEARPIYRDIIAELNSVKKAAAAAAGRKKSTAPKPKKKPAAKQMPTKSAVNMDNVAMDKFDPAKYGVKKKNSILSLIKVAVLIGILAYGGFFLWNNGFLAGIIPNAPYPEKADYLPEITKLIKAGKSMDAAHLAKLKLDKSKLPDPAMRQAVVQLAVNAYLNNDRDPAATCKVLSQRLLSAGVPLDSPEIALMKYLSNTKADADYLRNKLLQLKAKEMMLVAEIAIFVKETYLNQNKVGRKVTLKSYAARSNDVPEGYWGLGWGPRIQPWYDWIVSKKGDLNRLEPLFRRTKSGLVLMKTDNADVASEFTMDDLTVEWLEEHREFASQRLKPKDYTLTDASLAPYLSTLQDSHKKGEMNRCKLIKRIKFQLCKKMFIKPYGGSIEKVDGTVLDGTVIGNSKGLKIHNSEGNIEEIPWSEINVGQFIKLLSSYAEGLEDKHAEQAASEYLKIAVLCDWYEKYKDAVAFAHKAVTLDSALGPKVIQVMME